MADRTILTKSTAPGGYAAAGVAVTMTAADVSVQNRFVATGKELVVAHNTDSGAHTVTITSSTDPRGRSGTISAESIAAGAIRVYGPFPLLGWVQTTGYVHLEANSALVKFGVVVLP